MTSLDLFFGLVNQLACLTGGGLQVQSLALPGIPTLER